MWFTSIENTGMMQASDTKLKEKAIGLCVIIACTTQFNMHHLTSENIFFFFSVFEKVWHTNMRPVEI